MSVSFHVLNVMDRSIVAPAGVYTPAGSTTLTAAASLGQPVIQVSAFLKLPPGSFIRIDAGGGNQEDHIVNSNASSLVSLRDNLINNQSNGETVDVLVRELSGREKKFANDMNLDTFAETDQPDEEWWLWIDTLVATTTIDGLFMIVSDFDTTYKDKGLNLLRSGNLQAHVFVQSFADFSLGNGDKIYLRTLTSPQTDRYFCLRMIQSVAETNNLKMAAFGVTNVFTLSKVWDYQSPENRQSFNISRVSASGRRESRPTSGSIKTGRQLNWRGMSSADLALLDSVFAACNGTHLPFIITGGTIGSEPTGAEIWRFATDQAAVRPRDGDLFDVSVVVEDVMRIEDGESL